MYEVSYFDLRKQIKKLSERCLHVLADQMVKELPDNWKSDLKAYVDVQYNCGNHQANYTRAHDLLNSKGINDFSLDELDITALAPLFRFYSKFLEYINSFGSYSKQIVNYIRNLQDDRNALEHYPDIINNSDKLKFYFDEINALAAVISFASLMHNCIPLKEWNAIISESIFAIKRFAYNRFVVGELNGQFVIEDDIESILEEAELGKIESQVLAGKAYFYGKIIDKDYEKAFMWFYKAAKRNNIEAKYYLSKFFACGYGTEINKEAAKKYFDEALNAGWAKAQFDVARDYVVSRNFTPESLKLLQITADKGITEAKYLLSCAYICGWYGKKDQKKGNELLKEAALEGYDSAATELAKAALKDKNYDEAIKWLELLKNQGDEWAIRKIKEISNNRNPLRQFM